MNLQIAELNSIHLSIFSGNDSAFISGPVSGFIESIKTCWNVEFKEILLSFETRLLKAVITLDAITFVFILSSREKKKFAILPDIKYGIEYPVVNHFIVIA
jgi:hypothetical protein